VKAIVSGRSGTALIFDDERVLSIDVRAPDRIVERNAMDVNHLIDGMTDAELFADITQEQVGERLVVAARREEALAMAHVLLDEEEAADAKRLAAQALDELFQFVEVKQWIEAIVLSRPVPHGFSAAAALRACEVSSAPVARALFETLIQDEKSIERVWVAWEAIPSRLFEDDRYRENVKAASVRAGLFRRLQRYRGFENWGPAGIVHQFERVLGPRAEDILSAWMERIHPRERRVLDTREPERERSVLATPSSADQRVWHSTDLVGESLSISQPFHGLELLSVRDSTRRWTEVHTEFDLALVTSGPSVEIDWRTRGREILTRVGELMAIEPGEVHVTRHVNSPASFERVRVAPALIDRAITELDERRSFHFRQPGLSDPIVKSSIEHFVAAYSSGAESLEVESAAVALVSNLVTRLNESVHMPAITLDPVRDYRLRRVRDILRASVGQKPSLDALAQDSGMSKFRLCTVFKAAYGVSIGQYWAALRVSEAIRRLDQDVPIAEVVRTLGYGDEAFFTRVFRKHRGVTPRVWLAMRRSGAANVTTRGTLLA